MHTSRQKGAEENYFGILKDISTTQMEQQLTDFMQMLEKCQLRQGVTISHKLFLVHFEEIFKKFDWRNTYIKGADFLLDVVMKLRSLWSPYIVAGN